MTLRNSATFISGYSQGLGKALALSLFNKTFVVGISRNKNDEVPCKFEQLDISNYKKVEREISKYDFLGDVKLNVILCAGTLGVAGGLLDTDLSSWDDVITTNFLGNLAVIKALLPQMISSQYGRIVFLSGGGAANAFPEFSAYSISKTAVVREVENIAVELRDQIKDFSVIALAPGAMETDMLKQVRAAGVSPRTVVDIKEPVEFITKFLSMDAEKAKSLSGKFIHVRDDLNSDYTNKWLLRRSE